jgi:hypothetical protein
VVEGVVLVVRGEIDREGKVPFVESDVAAGVDATRGTIQTSVSFVFGSIPDEDTRNRSGCKLVWDGGRSVRVAEAPVHTEVVVARG